MEMSDQILIELAGRRVGLRLLMIAMTMIMTMINNSYHNGDDDNTIIIIIIIIIINFIV